MRSTLAAAALSLGLAACSGGERPIDMETLVRSLDLDPPVDLDVDCPPPPPDAQRVLFAGVFANSPPILPGAPGFPSDFCPSNAGFFARADGRGRSSLLGEFVWSERYCTLPPGELIAEGSFEGAGGDRLTWDARIRFDSVPPPIPFATFSGEFTFTGGTGPYEGVSGEGVVAARQLGDAAPDRPAGSTAAAVCGWISSASSAPSSRAGTV